MDKDIYMMKLHETVHIDNYTAVRRVPGGWIYVEMMTDVEHQTGVTNSTSTFVPFNNEFMQEAD